MCLPTKRRHPLLVARGLTTNAELQALIDDYLAKADHLGYPPMHG
jgi:hypothetical protein